MSGNHRDAKPREVVTIERAIDASFKTLALPADEYYTALWHFLTVSEDLPRFILFRTSGNTTPHGESDDLMMLSSLLDNNKYALRYIMEIIERQLPKARTLYKRVQADKVPYTTAARGLEIARDYRTAVGLFTLYHAGEALCAIDEKGDYLWFSFPGHSEQYSALDYSVGIEESHRNAIGVLFAWMKYPGHAPAIVKQIGDSVAALEGDRLTYEFDNNLATGLARMLPNPKSWGLVPPRWSFPWGSQAEVKSLWNSLELRCAYHLLAINFGAGRLQITGGGADDLCLRMKRGQLVQEIKRISAARLDRIVGFVQGMTYGKATRTPDPALQPLIPCGEDELLVPCTHILSSRVGRNLLSLHARVHEKSFNSQSAAFEEAMVRDVAGLASAHFPFVRAQFHFGPTGEIDLVIVDEGSATILIGELRWMIPPGDARETVNRINVCREKITQVERKIIGVKKNALAFLKKLGWKGGELTKWEVVGMGITENFVFRSSDPEIPMLPLAILRVGLAAGMSAGELHRWAKTEKWLPRKGEHFEVVQGEVRFDQHTLGRNVVTKLRPLKYLREFLPETVKEGVRIKA